MNKEQIQLRGMWKEYGGGCPHYRGSRDGVGRCIENEMRSCEYELDRTCDEWQEILREWHEEEKWVCGKCRTLRTGDERVARGQPCQVCSEEYTLPARIRSIERGQK